MKRSIGKRVLVLVFGPFLLILGILSAFISYTVIQNIIDWTELELKGITDINAAQLEGKIDSVRITVLTAASALNKINTSSPKPREQAAEIVRTMFSNGSVYNAWLVYEPNAFDGRDAEHEDDYPGAPSGRFMLSYVTEREDVIVAPDMSEESIDDIIDSPWYVIPRDEGRLYIDVTNDTNENLYDYGVGGDPVYTLSIVMPLFRNGRVIGCVGADVMFDTMTFGIDNAKNAAVAVFYPDGRVFYAENISFAEDSIETLSFINIGRIREAFESGESIFISNEFCSFLNERAFVYFHPMSSAGMGNERLFLYVALPRYAVLVNVIPVLAPVAVTVILFLTAIIILYIYILRKVFRPVRQLTLSADAISQGDLQTEVTIFSISEDEIGTLSRSLHRMIEQFRVYIFRQDQLQEETTIHSFMYVSSNTDDSPAAYASLTSLLLEYFKVNRVSLILINGGKASVVSVSSAPGFIPNAIEPYDFIHHTRVMNLISPNKMIVFLNKNAIERHNISFIAEDTVSVCFMPIWRGHNLEGYFIYENSNLKNAFRAGTESSLLFASRVMPEWLDGIQKKEHSKLLLNRAYEGKGEILLKENPVIEDTANTISGAVVSEEGEIKLSGADKVFSEAPEEEKSFAGVMRRLSGFDVDEAIAAMGHLEDIFEGSAGIFAKTAPESLLVMREYLENGDMSSFNIEIHGMKGALNNIGGFELGKEASHLEHISNEGEDFSQCPELYEAFSKKVEAVLEKLSVVMKEPETAKEPGDPAALKEALGLMTESLKAYDSLGASDILAPLVTQNFDAETDALLAELGGALEIFDCDGALEIISRIEKA